MTFTRPTIAMHSPALRYCGILVIVLGGGPRPAVFASSSATLESSSCPQTPCIESHEPCIPRTDDVWLVSTRCLGCPDTAGDPPGIHVEHYDFETRSWSDSTLEAFFIAQESTTPTVFWLHGNRIVPGEARSQGMSVYRQLTAGVSGDRPIRFVIYSWPTSPTKGFADDARRKAARTNSDGYYLAWLVNGIDSSVSVDFIGYSFGARIVTGALHLLGGGTLAGRTLPKRAPERAPMQAVLLAAAVNNNWLAVGRPHGEALPTVDRMLALNNSCDRALKRYRRVDPCNCPEALGYTGAVGPLGDNRYKLRQVDVCCVIGKVHTWENYFYTPSLVARMRPYVGLAD